jgi:hypothetical protein
VRIDTSESSPKIVVDTTISFNSASENICITCNSYVTGDVNHTNILIKVAPGCGTPIGVAPLATLASTVGTAPFVENVYTLSYNGGTRIEYNDDASVTQTVFGTDHTFLIVNNDAGNTCNPNTVFTCKYSYKNSCGSTYKNYRPFENKGGSDYQFFFIPSSFT